MMVDLDVGHGAVFGEHVIAKTGEQFLTADVLVVCVFIAEFFGGHVQCIAHEFVSGRVVAGVFLNGAPDGLAKGD